MQQQMKLSETCTTVLSRQGFRSTQIRLLNVDLEKTSTNSAAAPMMPTLLSRSKIPSRDWLLIVLWSPNEPLFGSQAINQGQVLKTPSTVAEEK